MCVLFVYLLVFVYLFVCLFAFLSAPRFPEPVWSSVWSHPVLWTAAVFLTVGGLKWKTHWSESTHRCSFFHLPAYYWGVFFSTRCHFVFCFFCTFLCLLLCRAAFRRDSPAADEITASTQTERHLFCSNGRDTRRFRQTTPLLNCVWLKKKGGDVCVK